MAGFLGAALLAAAAGAATAAEMKGGFAPSGGTSGAFKSGGQVFGKTGGDGGVKFVVPPGEGKGGKAPGFVYEYKTGDGAHRRKPHRFPRHRFPVIVYPLGGSYAIATEPYEEDEEEDAVDAGEDDGVFAITNGTDEEMTVYDNGKPVCVLAPKVRCSFDVSRGRHDVSVRLGHGEARREIPRPSSGKMIVVWEALKKAE